MWTNVPALNTAIADFLPVAIENRWNDPFCADGACWVASIQFRELLLERDFDPEYLEGTPEALGYFDRLFAGHYKFHTVVIARESFDYFLMDWTAAQYGYPLFPLVRPLSWADYMELRDRCASMTPPWETEPVFFS